MKSDRAGISAVAARLLFAVLLGAMVVGTARAQEAADGTVEAKLDAGTDRRIEERLEATFASLDSLAGVEVAVGAGVVKLSGEVDSSEARELAGALARQIEGVSAVDDEIRESRSLARRTAVLADELEERAFAALRFVPLLLAAVLVLAIALWIARRLGRADRVFGWLTRNVFLQDLARQAAQGGVVVVGALLALELLDATAVVGAVLGAAGLAGLAIGFAFRDLAENYIASILLSLRQPFAPNDHVLIEGYEGKVIRLTSRATNLMTFDGNHVRIPNARVFKAAIENFSRKRERRFGFAVGIGVDENLARTQDLAASVLDAMEGVLDDPAPAVLVETLGDSNVALRVYGWIDQEKSDFWRVRSEAIRLVKNALDAAGVEMPEPILRIRVEGAEEAAAEPDDGRTVEPTEARDVAADRHLDREIDAERAAEEPDLLQAEAIAE